MFCSYRIFTIYLLDVLHFYMVTLLFGVFVDNFLVLGFI